MSGAMKMGFCLVGGHVALDGAVRTPHPHEGVAAHGTSPLALSGRIMRMRSEASRASS